MVDRPCDWAQLGETALAFTPAGPRIQPALLSNIILWVFWVRHIHTTYKLSGWERTFNDISVFFPLTSVPPQIEGDSLMFGVQEEKVRINGSLTLSCLTKGFPEPKVHWFKDGQVGMSSYQALLEPQTCRWWNEFSLYWQPVRIATTSIELASPCASHLHSPDFMQWVSRLIIA